MLPLLKLSSLCLVVILTSLSVQAASTKFPSFNKSDDFRTLVETAIFSSDKEKEVKLSGKKYLLTVHQDIIHLLSKEFLLEVILIGLEPGDIKTFTFKDILPVFDFYKEALSHKTEPFGLKELITVIRKNGKADAELKTKKVSELVEIVKNLNDAAAAVLAASPEAFKDSKNLADFENKGLISKTTLSADGLTQTYKFEAGDAVNGTTLEFTVKKV